MNLRLPTSKLAGHVGLLPIRVDDRDLTGVEILPEKLTKVAYKQLCADLEATWAALIFDPDGNAFASALPSAVAVWRRIEGSVEAIRSSPRAELAIAHRFGRIERARRPRSLGPAVLRTVMGGTVLLDQIEPTVNVAENRIVAETLRALARLAHRQLDGTSVAATIERYLREPPFAGLPPAVEPLRPTQGMLRDVRYRVIYDALQLLRQTVARTDGPPELRRGLKVLPRLYEYWVFLQVLRATERSFGQPLGPGYGVLAHRIGRRRARLELRRGTEVTYPHGIVVAFEPRISTVTRTSWRGLELVPHPDPAYHANLATPDVVVLAEGPPVRALVLDAKYVARAFVERDALGVHAKYARIRHQGRPVVDTVLVAHPHRDMTADWAGYGYRPFVPGQPLGDLPWPTAAPNAGVRSWPTD